MCFIRLTLELNMLAVLFLLLIPTFSWGQNYYEESPVKLLIADFFGSHFPTSDSEHRLNLEGGADVEVPDIGDLETANNLPTKQLILHPGGTAVYELPTEDNSLFLMVKPGKKDPPPLFNNPFTDKANISIMVASVEGVPLVEVLCSVPENDRSSFASDYCVLSLESILEQASGSIRVTVSVSPEESRDAVLWQLELSPLDDSKRIKGTFEEEGRSLMRRTQEVEEFNTWLTLVSCVGKTGVGKSTITSLLSGNSTMFVSHASSHGTTTLGADISTIIPSRDYKDRMENVLSGGQLFEPSSSRPLFLIDSEGMGFRGDEVDFVATGPVAIVANIIIWITEGRMRPDVVLGELREYLKGLDRISIGEATSQGNDYGEFVVVLNKMQEIADTNEELCDTLLEWGRSPEDDETIEDLNTRFKSITCIGIPMVQLGEGEEFGYSVIQRYPRFVEGLTILGNQILSESDTPKNVKVGNELYQMNSTNAETIIGLLIDGANEGNIDLTDPCNVLYSLNKEKVVQGLSRMDSEFEQATADKCDMTMFCSPCVCEYRNSAAAFTKEKLSESVINGVAEAEILCNNIEVRDSIQELIEKFIEPWYISNLCIGDMETFETGDVCDISELQTKFDHGAADDLVVECNTVHLCGTAVLHNSKLSLITKQIFIAPGFQFEQEGPPKSPDGVDATTESGDGEDGSVGQEGKGITIEILGSLLTSSQSQMSVTLNGGEGGNGGNGGRGRDGISGESGGNGDRGTDGEDGKKGTDGKSFSPDHSKDASTCGHVLTWQGNRPNGNAVECCSEGHCCCYFDPSETGFLGLLSSIEEKVNSGCHHTHKYYQEYILSIDFIDPCDEGQLNGGDGQNGSAAGNGEQGKPGTNATMGTQGGNGGKGGDGGKAGQLVLDGNISLEVVLHSIGGSGGEGGLGGNGGAGAVGGLGGPGGNPGTPGVGGQGGLSGYCHSQQRDWTAKKHWHTSAGCHGFGGCSSSVHTVDDPCDSFKAGAEYPEIVYKQGPPGNPGAPGATADPGAPGEAGANVDAAPDGHRGLPGQEAGSTMRRVFANQIQQENPAKVYLYHNEL